VTSRLSLIDWVGCDESIGFGINASIEHWLFENAA
jgi:hypothetical protein